MLEFQEILQRIHASKPMIAAVTKSSFVLYFGDIPVFKSLAGYLCIVMFLYVQKKDPKRT